MGSRLSNTSWCWSPRKRPPEHVPPQRRKPYEEVLEEKMAAKEADRWNQAHIVEKDYDHNSYNDTWDGGGGTAEQVLETMGDEFKAVS
jgi:hypothetical protein